MIELNFNPFPVLTTERLIIRQLHKDDEQTIYRLRTDTEAIKYIARAAYTQLEQATKFIERINKSIADNEALFWAVTLKGDDKMLGTACMFNISKENARAEIGYDLVPEYRGKGIMQEAINAVINYGFNNLQLHSLEANINPANAASFKLAERCGFVKEAHFKENVWFDGNWRDTLIYSLLATKHTA